MLVYCYDTTTGAYLNRTVVADEITDGVTDLVPPFVPDPKLYQQYFRDGAWVVEAKPPPLPGEPGGRVLTDEEVDRVNAGEVILK
jgi:hypothetical protein